jgi:hypothetical protein
MPLVGKQIRHMPEILQVTNQDLILPLKMSLTGSTTPRGKQRRANMVEAILQGIKSGTVNYDRVRGIV